MRNIFSLLLLSISLHGSCQVVGGKAAFSFLNDPANAHLAALGKYNVSVIDGDPYLTNANPALLNKKMDKAISVSYMPFMGNIVFSSVAGAYNFEKIGPVSLSITNVNYGKFIERQEDGTEIGEFSAGEYAVVLGKSYTIGVITLGADVKFLGSLIGSYRAQGWATDLGALFKHPEQDFTFGFAVKNLGKVYKKYTETSKDSLPFDVQLGASYRFKHAPLRVSLTGNHLNKWDIVYNDPNQTTKVDEKGQPIQKKTKNFERLVRHATLALEIMPVKFLDLRFSYNYLMSRELSLTDGLSSAGISFGGAIRWQFLEAAYTHSIVSNAGGMNTFTLNMRLGEISDLYKREN